MKMSKNKHLPILVALLLVVALALAVLLLLPPAPSAPTQENPLVATTGVRNPAPVAITKVTDIVGRTCIVAIEMTDAGRALPLPTPDKPVYCLTHTLGQRDLGDAYGGTKPIPSSDLKKQFDSALASSRYRPADAEHPPIQVLIFFWGMHNKIELSDYHSANASDYANLLSRAKLIGGQKFADEYAQALKENDMKRFSARDDITRTLDREIWNDCYYLLVTSFDVEALRRNEKKLLWRMTISTAPQDRSLAATLPVMLNTAANFLGRETPPKIVRAPAPATATHADSAPP